MFKKIVLFYILYNALPCLSMERSITTPTDNAQHSLALTVPAYQPLATEPSSAETAAKLVACTICKHIRGAQITLPCGHHFCETCITRLRAGNQGNKNCPSCGGAIPPVTIADDFDIESHTAGDHAQENEGWCTRIAGNSPFKIWKRDNCCTVAGKVTGNCFYNFCFTPIVRKAIPAGVRANEFAMENCCFCPGICSKDSAYRRTACLGCCCVNEGGWNQDACCGTNERNIGASIGAAVCCTLTTMVASPTIVHCFG